MLVSHAHRFIYTKTAKTGGTSVESYFERYCVAPGTFVRQHERTECESPFGIVGRRGVLDPATCRWWNHMPAALIRERVGRRVWDSYLKFCVVRNPFEKAISDFYHQRSMRPEAFDPTRPDREQFDAWVAAEGPKDDADKYLIDGAFCLDAVLRYERLHADLEAVCARLGLPWDPSDLPTFKSGIRPPEATAARLYTDRARQTIATRFAAEIERFGYRFPTVDVLAGGRT